MRFHIRKKYVCLCKAIDSQLESQVNLFINYIDSSLALCSLHLEK